jgi:transposase
MVEITTVGLDVAKQVFQIHGVSGEGAAAIKRPLRRSDVLGYFGKLPPCVVGLEACGGSHFWAREIQALGHDVRMMPPAYVKPYVKRGKTDAIDAEAICEAASRPTMRFVPIKTADCQAAMMVLKTRDLLVRQRTQAINALRGHLAELGVVAGKGLAKVDELIEAVLDKNDARLPTAARMALSILADQIKALTERIGALEREIIAGVRRDETMRRLTTIPGIGPITAATIQSLVPDPGAFTSGRHFAAWIGLTPKMNSSGGKERSGKISKMGNPTLRSLLVVGATSVLAHARRGAPISPWLAALLARRPAKVVAIAWANKIARIVWALLTKGGVFIRNNGSAELAAA